MFYGLASVTVADVQLKIRKSSPSAIIRIPSGTGRPALSLSLSLCAPVNVFYSLRTVCPRYISLYASYGVGFGAVVYGSSSPHFRTEIL